MDTIIKPDARLCTAIPYLKRGGRVADIGTDHAYLPIYLVSCGLVSAALASDINQGPIDSARANIERAGLSQTVSVLRTDGLHGVEAFAPDDVLIFGMGGELIARILSEAPFVKNKDIGLILQPMSKAAALRGWLCENGFEILGESLSYVDRHYQTIYARYCGRVQCYNATELQIGRWNIRNRPPLFREFLLHEIEVWRRIVRGKEQSACADVTADRSMLAQLEQLLEEITT